MQSARLVSPSSIVLTVGTYPDASLSRSGALDAAQGFAARVGNLTISSSPIAMLFGADPDFQYFRRAGQRRRAHRRASSGMSDTSSAAPPGCIRKGGSEIAGGSAERVRAIIARQRQVPGHGSLQGHHAQERHAHLRGLSRARAASIRRPAHCGASGDSATAFTRGLADCEAPDTRPMRTRVAAYEVIEDTPAAFGLAIANTEHGPGRLPQVVVPSFESSLRYLGDYPLGP